MREVERPIAVFDSGLGGISVLRALVRLMPQENYLYFGDSLHAPYGTRSTQEIRDLSFAAAQALFAQGVKALVIACNTATSAAADELRAVRGEFTPSEFVKSITGVDNVCERAALRNAETLLVKKTARSGVTVAAAAEHWEVRFA